MTRAKTQGGGGGAKPRAGTNGEKSAKKPRGKSVIDEEFEEQFGKLRAQSISDERLEDHADHAESVGEDVDDLAQDIDEDQIEEVRGDDEPRAESAVSPASKKPHAKSEVKKIERPVSEGASERSRDISVSDLDDPPAGERSRDVSLSDLDAEPSDDRADSSGDFSDLIELRAPDDGSDLGALARPPSNFDDLRGGVGGAVDDGMNESGARELESLRAPSNVGGPFGAVRADSDLPIVRAQSLGDGVEITEQPEVPSLQLAVYETPANLQALAAAIESAGHAMALGASGKDGIDQLKEAVADSQIDVVIVGIPGGEPIIDAALALAPRGPVIIASSSGTAVEAVARANALGAELALVRPHDVTKVAPVLLAAARIVEHRLDLTTARGSEAVLRARLENLSEGDGSGFQPYESFQKALELELKRARRYQYPLSVALFVLEIPPPPPPPGVKGILRARAGNALIHTIRDIDLATEVDQDHFMVLLPYTDLTGATEVARRILTAVEACDPVTATGRTFEPLFTGAISGAKPGQQLSYAKLIRDATRALEAARRDGAELAVQP